MPAPVVAVVRHDEQLAVGGHPPPVDEPPRFADQPKERAGYRAPIAAASLERNAVTVVVVADRVGLGMARVSLDPPVTDR